MNTEYNSIDEIIDEIRNDGWPISGLLVPDDNEPTRAMLPTLAQNLEKFAQQYKDEISKLKSEVKKLKAKLKAKTSENE